MSTRSVLPNRRPSTTLEFHHGSILYKGTASFSLSGEILEIFLTAGKPGSEVEAVARDAAVVVSLALQYGTLFSILRQAITRLDDGTAAGPIGCLLDQLAEEGMT